MLYVLASHYIANAPPQALMKLLLMLLGYAPCMKSGVKFRISLLGELTVLHLPLSLANAPPEGAVHTNAPSIAAAHCINVAQHVYSYVCSNS